MKLSYFTGQPCKSRIAFEFVPKKETKLDLEKVAKKLYKAGVFIELTAPFLLMLKLNGTNVSVFKGGKIVVKGINEEKKSRKIAEKLISKMQ